MRTIKKDGTSTKENDWSEIAFFSWEFLILALFAAIGLISTINFLTHFH